MIDTGENGVGELGTNIEEEEEEEGEAALKDNLISNEAEESPSATTLQSQTGQSTVRERMRQRMLARRERPQTAEGETSEGERSKSLSMTSRRLRGLRDAKTSSRTRFDEADSKEEDELEQELVSRSGFVRFQILLG